MSYKTRRPQACFDDVQSTRHTHRLSHLAIEALNKWIKEHHDHPYPTKSEKVALQKSTGLSIHQIQTWFANARRRYKGITTPRINVDKDHSAILCVVDGIMGSSDELLPSNLSDATITSAGSTISTKLTPSMDDRIFHCTFCPNSFTSKFDWNRHETSVHLSLKRYICCPSSPFQIVEGTQSRTCTYCGLSDPTDDHIESHNHNACQSRPPEARIFLRKDHLRQHLRCVHECELLPHMNSWLLQAEYVNSRCGFCGERFTDWSTRNIHIAAHFKQGSQMRSWKGCRGLDSAVSAQVVGAMPSFLIGAQRHRRPSTHTAIMTRRLGNYGSNIDSNGISGNNSQWDILCRELQTFVALYSAQGLTVSDEVLRQHARRTTYGSAAVSDETAADHPEWLDTFKRAYCLEALPSRRSSQTAYDEDDLDVHHDLGLTMPYLQCQRAKALHILFLNRGPVQKSGRRFSSIAVPIHKAFPFETITAPWPDAGILGQTITVRDQMFSTVVKAQMNWTLHVEQSHTRQTNATAEENLCWADDDGRTGSKMVIYAQRGDTSSSARKTCCLE